MELAPVDPLSLAGGLLALSSLVVFGVSTALKGKPFVLIAGAVLTPVVWVLGSLRLAKPNSYWARRLYGEQKLARAQERFPGSSSAPDRSLFYAASIGGAFLMAAVWGVWQGLQ